MPTKTEIANGAMALLGQGRLADVDTDTSEPAKWVRAIYANSRDEALRAHPWNCNETRTILGENLLLQSDAFSNASWTKTNATATADQLRAPDGNIAADLLNDADGVNAGTVAQAVTVANNSDYHTLAVYLKQGTAAVTRVVLAYSGGTAGATLNVDVTWGATPTVSAGTITETGQGWWRVVLTLANVADGSTTLTATIYPAGSTGSATGTVYAWRAQLSQSTGAIGPVDTTTAAKQPSFPRHGFKYAHTLPPDWLRINDVNEGDRDYRIESGKLLTDWATVDLRYGRQLTSESDFDVLFSRALSVQLAKDLCVAITGSDKLMTKLEKVWDKALSSARTTESQEDGEEREILDPWIQARGA